MSFLVVRRMIDQIIKYFFAIAYLQFPIPIFQLVYSEMNQYRNTYSYI